jgi:hypothetical protein
MSRYCAWCQRYLGSVGTQTGVTHGICTSCAERQVKRQVECRMAPYEREGDFVCRDHINGQQ